MIMLTKVVLKKTRASDAVLVEGDICGALDFQGKITTEGSAADVTLAEIEGVMPFQPGAGADGMRPHVGSGTAPMMVRSVTYNGEVITTILIDLDNDNSVDILSGSDEDHVIGENSGTPAFFRAA